MSVKKDITRRMQVDEGKTKSELLYELRLQRLDNLRLRERLDRDHQHFADRRQLKYLENIALLDEAMRRTKNLDEMMSSLMEVIRTIFQCDQAWLMYPCDPKAPNWRVPFRSFNSKHPIPFGPEDDIPSSPDLAENCLFALKSLEPFPLGPKSVVKDVPEAARDAAAKSALLIALHPKVGHPWLLGLHQCSEERTWTSEEKQMYQDISGRVADALSATLFYRDLEQNQERLKHLSTQLFQAQEKERKRVAEEIHDELGQPILAVKMGIENALYLMENDASDAMKRSLQSASNMTKGVVDKIRTMQSSLYPPTLRDFGVLSALNGFLEDFSNIYSSMAVRKSILIQEESIPEELRVPLFRLAQESLYNAAKHSRANKVTVAIDRSRGQLSLKVIDNGVGFDPTTTIRYPADRLGLGLTSMQERAELSGGTLKISSEQGKGTTIHAIWTLPND